MKRTRTIAVSPAFILPLLLLFLSGCTEEKAEAVKVAAENFDKEASLAIDAYEGYFAQMIPDAALNDDEFVAAFGELATQRPETITTDVVDGLMGLLSTKPQPQQLALAEDFQVLRVTYQQFAGAFERVIAGNMFSRKPVKSAAGLAARLTVQLVKLRKQATSMPSIDAQRRSELEVTLRKILRDAPADARASLLQSEARSFIMLQAREAELADHVQAQFARAIIAGETVCTLVKNYDRLSVAEILAELQTKLSLAATITGRADVAALAGDLDGLEAQIRDDPFFAELIDRPVLNLTPATDGP